MHGDAAKENDELSTLRPKGGSRCYGDDGQPNSFRDEVRGEGVMRRQVNKSASRNESVLRCITEEESQAKIPMRKRRDPTGSSTEARSVP